MNSKPSEKQLERYLVNECKKRNILCFKFVSPQHAGVPDRICFYQGRTICIECKKHNGVLSALQKACIRQLQQQNIPVFVTYTKEDIDAVINHIVTHCK